MQPKLIPPLEELYRRMYTIRACEQYIIDHYHEDEMKTPMHMSMGSEAISVGVCSVLPEGSQVLGSYRSHALYLAWTDDVEGFFGELYGKVTGPGRGKQGSMHLADPSKGHMMSSAVVGSQISVAVGCAFAMKRKKVDACVAVFFGDAALECGEFWESWNLANLWGLPILFVCEDNGLSVHTDQDTRQSYPVHSLIDEAFYVTARDPVGIAEQVSYYMRTSRAPEIMLLKYVRMLEHVGIKEDWWTGYRDEPVGHNHDPIHVCRKQLGVEVTAPIELSIAMRVEKAAEAAKAAPFPDVSELVQGVYAK